MVHKFLYKIRKDKNGCYSIGIPQDIMERFEGCNYAAIHYLPEVHSILIGPLTDEEIQDADPRIKED